MQEMGTKERDLRNTRLVLVLPQTANQNGTEFHLWINEFLEVNSTPNGIESVKVPIGLAGSWQDWINVGNYLRSAMRTVDRKGPAAGA